MKSKVQVLKDEYPNMPIYWKGNTPYIYEWGVYNYQITAHYNRELKKYIFIKTRKN